MDPVVCEIGHSCTNNNYNSQPTRATSLRSWKTPEDKMNTRRLLISLLKAPMRRGRCRVAILAAMLFVSAALLLWLLLPSEYASSHVTTHQSAIKRDSAKQSDAIADLVRRREGERADVVDEVRDLLVALSVDDSDATYVPTDGTGDAPSARTDDKGLELPVSRDSQGNELLARVDDESHNSGQAKSRQSEERMNSLHGDGPTTTTPLANVAVVEDDSTTAPGVGRLASFSPPQAADAAVVLVDSSTAYSDESIVKGKLVAETTMRHETEALPLEASSQTNPEVSSPLTPDASPQSAHEASSTLTAEASSQTAHEASSPLTSEETLQPAVLPAESATTWDASGTFAGVATDTTTSEQQAKGDVATVYIGFSDPLARLGNKLFQYASGLSLALRYHRPAVLVHPESESARALEGMRRVFSLSSLPVLLGPPPLTASNLVESGWGRYDAARFDSASTFDRSVYTVGYFQSWKYFAPVADRVRREFALTADAERVADSYFRSVGLLLPPHGGSRNNSTCSSDAGSNSSNSGGCSEARLVRVGVHVRRGDMLHLSHLYTVAPAEYLLKAIEHYRDKYAAPQYNVAFVFATDDQAWVRDLVASRLPRELVVHYVSFDAGGDMAVLSRCDHSIVTGGTFGWWAAWLAGGDVVYYKDFIRPESPLYAGYDPADYYPPSWIGLTA